MIAHAGPVPNSLTRRSLLAALGGLSVTGVLSACSSGQGTAPGAGAAAGAPTRTVTDASGEAVEVPVDPSRVVVLHYAGTQAAMDLGLTPIGTGPAGQSGSDGEPYVPPELWAKLKDVPIVVDQETPQVETIAELAPDLVLAPNIIKPEILTQLQGIAPVFQFTLRGGRRKDWEGRVKEVAEALNRNEEYQNLHSGFAAELEANAKTYADRAKGLVVAVIGSYQEGTVYAWGQDNMQGTIVTPLGLTWSPSENAAVAGQKEPEASVSLEKLMDTVGDADILFYDTDLQLKPGSGMPGLQASAIYQQLPAVQRGNAFPFGKNTIAGFSDARFSMDRVIEGLEKYRA